jgi:hypothetical protein
LALRKRGLFVSGCFLCDYRAARLRCSGRAFCAGFTPGPLAHSGQSVLVREGVIVELIKPFYLKMMGMNALMSGVDLLPDVARIGRGLDAADVIQLLRAAWRPRVMGAWFALVHDEPEVTGAVLTSLETSLGGLTSLNLAVAAVILAGSDAFVFARAVCRVRREEYMGRVFVRRRGCGVSRRLRMLLSDGCRSTELCRTSGICRAGSRRSLSTATAVRNSLRNDQS